MQAIWNTWPHAKLDISDVSSQRQIVHWGSSYKFSVTKEFAFIMVVKLSLNIITGGISINIKWYLFKVV